LFAACTVVATALSAQESTEPAEPVEEKDNTAAFQAMGYAMGQQLRLNVGFSDEELAQIFYGMRLAASGEDQPANFQSAVQEAQGIYMARMREFQAKEQARMQAIAEENKEEAEAFFTELEQQEGIQQTESGLYYKILSEGNGTQPVERDKVIVNYEGKLISGEVFDANDGAEFAVNQVVPGFKEGLQLMSEGATARFYLPSELGYGDRPQRPGSIIEPGDALIFEVDLLEVKAAPKPPKDMPAMNKESLGKPPPPPPIYTPPPPPDYTPPPPPGMED